MGDINIKFPIGGIHEGAPFTEQPPSTTSDALNVTGQDPVSGRTRGAQRAGMSKYNTNVVGTGKVSAIQCMTYDSSPASITAYASGSEATSWTKTLPGKSSVWCMATDLANNVYVIDSGATIVKYNPTGYQLYSYKVPVKDEGHEIRSIAVDQSGLIYVGVSIGGQQNTAHIFALEEINGTSGEYLEKVWEYKTERYVSKLVYSSGKLYAALNDTSKSESSILVLSSATSAVPSVEKEVAATYPIGDIAISPKDGGIVSTSPVNTARGGDRTYETSFKSPKSVDWDPSKLEGFERRIWAWLDSTDIDGDGTNNEAYEDGEEILRWYDKSGNGRDLGVRTDDPGNTYWGPLLSKKGFNGNDCLAFSGANPSGSPTLNRFLGSSGNVDNFNGDSATNSNSAQNLALVPTHRGASFAMFIVFEAIDDGYPQTVWSRRMSGFTKSSAGNNPDYVGICCITANHRATPGSISNAVPSVATSLYPTVIVSPSSGYTPGVCSLLGIGQRKDPSIVLPTMVEAFLGDTNPSSVDEQMGTQPGGSHPMCHSGKSKSNRYVVSYISRNRYSGSVIPEALNGGEAGAGGPTTDVSHYRVNGQLCQTFYGLNLYAGEGDRIGALSPTVEETYASAVTSFKGRICEIIVLKEWYYRADETSAPVRLNVCSSRAPAHTAADHGEYSSVNYTSGSQPYPDTEAESKIYETELIEGYLAHKWGIADELPSQHVGYIVINGNGTIANDAEIQVPAYIPSTVTFTFKTSATATSPANLVYVPPGAASAAQLQSQALELYKAINGSSSQFATGPYSSIYAMPPTFSGLLSATASDRHAIIELRTRSAMVFNEPSGGFSSSFSTTSARVSFKGYDSSFTSATPYVKFVPRTRITYGGSNGYGINYSIHPFAEHKRQIHASSSVPSGWSFRNFSTARTLGGPPRADGKRKFQPLQVLSSSSQNLVKYDSDSGKIKWCLYNASPEFAVSGGAYAGYGGLGFSASVNSDGLICTSGQRVLAQTYPAYTEQNRRGIQYPSNLNDIRATNDIGASWSFGWQKQLTASGVLGLDSSPGWARSFFDEKKNLVLPIADQDEVLSSVVVLRSTDGGTLNEHTLNPSSEQYQIGLSAASSSGTISLPASFSNPRSEYIYLGTRCENTSIVTFTTQPSAGDTIRLSDGPDVRTYTFVSSVSAANHVKIDTTLALTIGNLKSAINNDGIGVGSDYGSGTAANTSIVARRVNALANELFLSALNPEPSGGVGVFTFSTTGTSFASMSPVVFRDACLRRVNLLNAAPSGSASSPRANKNVAIDGQGGIYTFEDTGSPSLKTGASFSSTAAQYYDTAVLYQKMYITNGFEVLVYDPLLDSVSRLESKQSGAPTERWSLVASWRGRLVLARSLTSPHNWIMSAIGDPTNWDLFPPVVNPSQAVSGTVSRAGLVPDIVNALIPYSDDLMLFGGDHSIYRLTGDPMSGGQMDLVTDVTGIAFGHAWDKDPQGVLYFMSSRGALYAWPPGGRIVELSLSKFEQRLADIDFSQLYTRLVWNDMDRTLHVFAMPYGATVSGLAPRHFRYERDSKAFWEDTYGNPVSSVAVADGDSPNDRRLLIGSTDGYIRKWDTSAADDDGAAIDSYVTFGPFGSQEAELRLSMIQAVLSDNQGGAHVQLFAGDTPDVIGDPVWAGKLTSGRNPNMFTRVRGSYFWIRLRNSAAGERWAFENMTVRVAQAGRRRVR